MSHKKDALLVSLAARQRGLFTKAQLRRLGYTDAEIKYRLARRYWLIRMPGVFLFPGTELDWEADLLATVYWSRGIASHRAAARLHRLPGIAHPGFEVTTHDKQIMSRCGIDVHHTNRMPRDHIVSVGGIACSSVERTLLDLGAVVSPGRVAVALDHALLTGMTTLGAVDHCLYFTARRGRRGCRVLRELIARRWNLLEPPNSPLETVIFDLLVGYGLPLPDPQVEIYDSAGRFIARPDFVYPQQRAVIEGHSKQWHSMPQQRADDLVRHERLVAERYRVLYVTWYDVTVIRTPTAYRIETSLSGGEGDKTPPDPTADVTKEW